MSPLRPLVAVGWLCVAAAGAAQPVAPPQPTTVQETPAWSRTVTLQDGRVFITDGGLALAVAVARPKTMPPDIQGEQAADTLARHLALVNPTDVGLGELKPGAKPNSFVAPNGISLNGNYIAFLRRTVPAARLRMNGPTDPIVIGVDGTVVGVFMPLRP